mgnify:CR=1 FL=1
MGVIKFTALKNRLLRYMFRQFSTIRYPPVVAWFIGGVLVLFVASCIGWLRNEMRLPSGAAVMFFATAVTFFFSVYVTTQMRRHASDQGALVSTTLVVCTLFLGLFAFLLLFRAYYSRSFLIAAFIATLCVLYISMFFFARQRRLIYGVVPPLNADVLPLTKSIEFVQLRTLGDSLEALDGLMVHYESLTDEWQARVAAATAQGLFVREDTDFLESVTGRVSTHIRSLIRANDFKLDPIYSIVKRVIDVAVTVALLPVFFVIVVIFAPLIRAESQGPIFYRQLRVGQGGKSFTIYKFRSMRVDADQDGHDFAQVKDPRVTRVGRFMRRTRLDELPQLLNVLWGEMSLIGPRPEQHGFVQEFRKLIPFYDYRHMVKPGITGWAQVSHGYAACLSATREKLEYDLYYAKYCSFWLDVLIVFKTFRTVLVGFGVR